MSHDTTRPSGSAPQPGAPQPAETVPAPAPLVPATAPAAQTNATTPPQYELGDEVARGGMGIVYCARDRKLSRRVAIKTFLPGVTIDAVAVARFEAEARITARLQHPNVPPVYNTGAFADGRPYLVMKLIEGKDLSRLLDKRAATTDELPRYVAAFEQVCRVVGYAHTRGVIHRDLKPSNVMIGAFDEVQVMDWGIAKVVGAPDATATGSGAPAATGATAAGRALGTPHYMAPEQAKDARAVDQRADVFALGGILAALLTGSPPFTGHTVYDILFKAEAGEVAECFARLDACDADAELVALAKRCLAPARDARPANGSEVAAAVAAYRAGIEARVRRAETERAAAEARASEEANTRAEAEERLREHDKRRRAQRWLFAAVAAVLVLVAGTTAGFVWVRGERRAAEAKLEGERDAEARNKAEQTRKGIDESFQLATELKKKYQFKQADAALARAEQLASAGAPDRTAEIKLARRDLALAVKLDDIRYRSWMVRDSADSDTLNEDEDKDRHASSDARNADKYRLAFKESGIDPLNGSVAELSRRISSSFARTEIIAAVDNWAFYAPAGTRRDRLLEVARKADPDVWRDRLRDPSVRDNAGALAELNRVVEHLHQSPAAMSDLARLLARQGKLPTGLVWTAHHARPDEYELSLACGLLFDGLNPHIALGGYEAALAVRPTNPYVLTNLGGVYRSVALLSETEERRFFNERASAAFLRAIDLAPELANPHSSVGVVFLDLGKLQLALGHGRRAVDLEPTDPQIRVNYGVTLRRAGDLDGAIEQARKAIELRPRYANAHHNLGIALRAKGERKEALDSFRSAITYDPNLLESYNALGETCLTLDRPEEARSSALAALKVNPKYANGHYLHGRALRALGDEPGALEAFAEAHKINAKLPPNGPPTDKKP